MKSVALQRTKPVSGPSLRWDAQGLTIDSGKLPARGTFISWAEIDEKRARASAEPDFSGGRESSGDTEHTGA